MKYNLLDFALGYVSTKLKEVLGPKFLGVFTKGGDIWFETTETLSDQEFEAIGRIFGVVNDPYQALPATQSLLNQELSKALVLNGWTITAGENTLFLTTVSTVPLVSEGRIAQVIRLPDGYIRSKRLLTEEVRGAEDSYGLLRRSEDGTLWDIQVDNQGNVYGVKIK